MRLQRRGLPGTLPLERAIAHRASGDHGLSRCAPGGGVRGVLCLVEPAGDGGGRHRHVSDVLCGPGIDAPVGHPSWILPSWEPTCAPSNASWASPFWRNRGRGPIRLSRSAHPIGNRPLLSSGEFGGCGRGRAARWRGGRRRSPAMSIRVDGDSIASSTASRTTSHEGDSPAIWSGVRSISVVGRHGLVRRRMFG